MSALDQRERAIAADSADAQENPLYACRVKYVEAHTARAAGVPVDENLPPDAKIGIVDHSVAWDPKYPPESQEPSPPSP